MNISFRIGPSHWLNNKQLNHLFDFFKLYSGLVDELAFFTQDTHAPLPLDEIKRRTNRLSKILPLVRSQGMRAGINVLATIGHHEENLDNSLSSELTGYQPMVGTDGQKCLGTFCPADQKYLDEYIKELYSMVASTKPDFIWIDDDVRFIGHKPIKKGCFCDKCIEKFSSETGVKYTRESLVNALEEDKSPDFIVRRKWLEHNRQLIDNLFRVVEKTVHRISPEMPLGFMTGDRFYEGYAFERWAKTLRGTEENAQVRWRPGGGFYSDECLTGLVEKAHDIGRQVSKLPEFVEDIQSEIENFPYHILKKSVQTTVLEAGAHIASGTTGTAFNVLTMHPDPLDEYIPFLEEIKKCKPFYESVCNEVHRSPCEGVFPAWNENLYIVNGLQRKRSWLETFEFADFMTKPYILAEIGIPVCYSPVGASVTAFSGSTPMSFTTAVLEEIFKKGVLLDVPALNTLQEMGLSHLCGVKVKESSTKDMRERLTDHPLNDRFSGWMRDCRQSFWEENAYSLEPIATAGNVEILSKLVDYADCEFGPCMTAFENESGGRVIVSGYYPWARIHNSAKVGQLKSVIQWLSHNSLPAIVETFAKVVMWVRTNSDGDKVVIFINASLDSIPELKIKIKSGGAKRFSLMTPGKNKEEKVQAERSPGNDYVRVILKNIDAWSMHILRPI